MLVENIGRGAGRRIPRLLLKDGRPFALYATPLSLSWGSTGCRSVLLLYLTSLGDSWVFKPYIHHYNNFYRALLVSPRLSYVLWLSSIYGCHYPRRHRAE